MITKSKQNWEVGQTVKVGFLTNKVIASRRTPGDFLPDAYLLASLVGGKVYEFVPHNGCRRVDPSEAHGINRLYRNAAA